MRVSFVITESLQLRVSRYFKTLVTEQFLNDLRVVPIRVEHMSDLTIVVTAV